MKSGSRVIKAILAKLVAAEYNVVLFREIDEDVDLPCVSVVFAEDGETIELDPNGSQETKVLQLHILWVDRVPEGDEIVAMETAETLRDTIIDHRADTLSFLTDDNGRVCRYIEASQLLVETRPADSETVAARLTITAVY
jgi:hypothetical protein